MAADPRELIIKDAEACIQRGDKDGFKNCLNKTFYKTVWVDKYVNGPCDYIYNDNPTKVWQREEKIVKLPYLNLKNEKNLTKHFYLLAAQNKNEQVMCVLETIYNPHLIQIGKKEARDYIDKLEKEEKKEIESNYNINKKIFFSACKTALYEKRYTDFVDITEKSKEYLGDGFVQILEESKNTYVNRQLDELINDLERLKKETSNRLRINVIDTLIDKISEIKGNEIYTPGCKAYNAIKCCENARDDILNSPKGKPTTLFGKAVSEGSTTAIKLNKLVEKYNAIEKIVRVDEKVEFTSIPLPVK